jgi:hypothetical protein
LVLFEGASGFAGLLPCPEMGLCWGLAVTPGAAVPQICVPIVVFAFSTIA